MKLNTYDRQAFVKAVMNDVPLPDANKVREEVQAALVKAMSPACRSLYKKSPKALRREYTHDLAPQGISLIAGDADFETAVEPWRAAYHKRYEIKNQLSAAIQACSTLKQAKERFPDLVKYLPADRTTTGVGGLPAVANIAENLKALGWPKAAA